MVSTVDLLWLSWLTWCGKPPPYSSSVHSSGSGHRTGPRSNTDRAQRYPANAMAIHQAMAITALLPIGAPLSSPLSVSMIEVKGWYSANQRTSLGIVAKGTNALLINGSRNRGITTLLAASGVLVTRPSATASQVSARANSASTVIAAIHSAGSAVGRKPRSRLTAMTRPTLSIVWIMAPTTCPVSMEAREIAMVRKRATMPSAMSVHTATAVGIDPEPTVITRIPGTT